MLINAENLILGRLASFVAKQALLGQEIIILNSEKAIITGSKKQIFKKYKEKIKKGNPFKGPFFPRTPERILRRTIRSMLPYKKQKGKKAFKNIKCFINIPDQYKNKPLTTIEQAHIKNFEPKDYITLQELSKNIR